MSVRFIKVRFIEIFCRKSIYGTTVRLKDLSALKGVYFTENPLYFLILPAGLFHSGQLFSSELKRNTIRILC